MEQFEQLFDHSNPLSPVMKAMIINRERFSRMADYTAKVMGNFMKQTDVPHAAVDVVSLVKAMREDKTGGGADIYREVYHTLVEMDKGLRRTVEVFPEQPKDLKTAEVNPGLDPVASGSKIQTFDIEAAKRFCDANSDDGIVSRNVLQNMPFTEWKHDELHEWNVVGRGRAGNCPSGSWPEPKKVPKAPVQIYSGVMAAGLSFKKETLRPRLIWKVKDGMDCETGQRKDIADLKRLATRCKRNESWDPTAGPPLAITKKIDGRYGYLRSQAGTGYLQFRNGDYAEILGLPDCSGGLEFYDRDGHYALFLLWLKRWRFTVTPFGYRALRHFAERKTIYFKEIGGIIKRNIKLCHPMLGDTKGIAYDGIIRHYPDMVQKPVKFASTADFDKTALLLLEHFPDDIQLVFNGMKIDKTDPRYRDKVVFEGVKEFIYARLNRPDGTVRHSFVYLKDRPDKLKGNSIEGIRTMMLMPTVDDVFRDLQGQVMLYDPAGLMADGNDQEE